MTPAPLPVEQAQRTLKLMPRFNRWAAIRVAAQAGADLDLSLRQYAALYAIREGASSPTELARRWLVTPAVVTGVVDRLVRRGLVRREPDLADRRRSRLMLTDAGLAASLSIERALAEELAAQLSSATAAEREAFDRAIGLLERAIGALEALTPTPDGPCLRDEEAGWSEPDSGRQRR